MYAATDTPLMPMPQLVASASPQQRTNGSKRIKTATNTSEKVEKLSVSDGSTINRSCKSVNRVTVANNISPTVGFSPKRVLQGNSSSRVYTNGIELEPGRCRRTDGKRWQCSRDVITDKKILCTAHSQRC